MKFMRCLFLIPLLFSFLSSEGQIRIEVTRHPKFSVSDSSIFLSGTFNSWSPGDENYKLTRGQDGVYFFDLPDSLNHFEYKFTQGTWALVEGTADSKARPNRLYSRKAEENPKLIRVEIEGWESQPAYIIIVKRIPTNTPHDASLFIMGDFNNWNPSDKSYKLTKQVDGTFRTLIYSPYPKVQFKFTRGTATSVESKPGGRFLPIRVVTRDMVKSNSIVELEVLGWMDMSDGLQLYSIYELLLLFSFFQGLLLIITMPSIQGYNRSANRWLLILIGFSSVILLLKVVAHYPSVATAVPKLQLLPDFIFFIYFPLFYLYIQRLLFQRQVVRARIELHFIPALIQFFVYMVYFLMDNRVFETKFGDPISDLYMVRFAFGCVALFVNLYYWFASNKALKMYKENYEENNSYEQNLQYLSTVLFIQAICLFAWLATALLAVLGWVLGFEVSTLVELIIETIWIVFSMITFFLGYFAIHEPDLFRLPEFFRGRPMITNAEPLSLVSESENITIEDKVEAPIENIEKEIERVSAFMTDQRPYINSKLNLVELASHLSYPPYLLSKIINTGFGKNFFDFVNSYRVEEFKKRVEEPQFRNHTLLSIAFDVGFNSKTAFNRSFKKITNQTPSSFFNNRREY